MELIGGSLQASTLKRYINANVSSCHAVCEARYRGYGHSSGVFPHRVLVDPKPHLVVETGDQVFGSGTMFFASAVVELRRRNCCSSRRTRFFHTTHSSIIQGKDVRKAGFLGRDRCTQPGSTYRNTVPLWEISSSTLNQTNQVLKDSIRPDRAQRMKQSDGRAIGWTCRRRNNNPTLGAVVIAVLVPQRLSRCRPGASWPRLNPPAAPTNPRRLNHRREAQAFPYSNSQATLQMTAS